MHRLCRFSALAITAVLAVTLVLWPGGYLADVVTQANSVFGDSQLVSNPEESMMAAEPTHAMSTSAMTAQRP